MLDGLHREHAWRDFANSIGELISTERFQSEFVIQLETIILSIIFVIILDIIQTHEETQMKQDLIVKDHLRAVTKFNSQQDEYQSFIVKKRKTEPSFGYSSPRRTSNDQPAVVVQRQNQQQLSDQRRDQENQAVELLELDLIREAEN